MYGFAVPCRFNDFAYPSFAVGPDGGGESLVYDKFTIQPARHLGELLAVDPEH